MTTHESKSKNHEGHAGGVVAAGIIGAVAAAAAGAYFLYGTKDGKKVQRQIRGWALRAKGEVLEKMERLKEVNEDKYNEVVDSVMKRYKALKEVDAAELKLIAEELKGHWNNIRKEIEAGAKKVQRAKHIAVTAKKNATRTRKKASK